MAMARRIVPDRCAGIIVDFHDFFLAQLDKSARLRIKANTRVLRVSSAISGSRSSSRWRHRSSTSLGREADVFEKDYFDLTEEWRIEEHLSRLKLASR